MFTTLALAVLLAQAPSSDTSYEGARWNVRAAVDEIKRDVSEGNADALKQALTELHEFAPALAEDEDALEERKLAYLALVYAYLVLGDRFQAERTMDEALRVAMGTQLPVEPFGPKVAQLHAEREHILEASGRASIGIECAVPCRVLLAEQAVPDVDEPGMLYLGAYRVWIEALDGSTEPLRKTVELTQDGQHEVIEFGADQPVVEPALPPSSVQPQLLPSPGPKPAADTVRRTQPRWAEIVGMTVGAGLMVAGGLLVALDGRCPDLTDMSSGCDNIYETNPAAGYSLLALGGGLLLVDGVMLTIDEVRVGRGQKHLQVSVGWTLRF